MDKRLTIELKTEDERETIREFKSECYRKGLNMREKILALIRQFLTERRDK